MNTHAPKNYICPICLGVQGVENEQTLIRKQDILYRDDAVMVLIASYFIKGSEGHLIVVPTRHFENIYDLPDEIGARIFSTAKEYAIKMKSAYGCDGVNLLQNNEPAAGQHAFHYHLHLFPRYDGDSLWENMGKKREVSLEERKKFVDLFR
ncbi:MAG: diadenosine tetraphosphate hydrolase [Candidatus Pacebacteria bacterium CG10_big_fil_rev_8_21_14_0_10_42_12]|nr:MAG: diadenosine tetraphosphate hydrolase [Candidatus Pacebacteria bacterium CG10_big_fil_rev_8_21_14_0_10_42_12]